MYKCRNSKLPIIKSLIDWEIEKPASDGAFFMIGEDTVGRKFRALGYYDFGENGGLTKVDNIELIK